MKKKFIALCLASAIRFTCVCSVEISSTFEEFLKNVTTSVKLQTEVIKNQNIPEIEKSISLLTEENELLEQLIATENQLSVQRASLLFELERKIKLMR